MTMVVSSSTFIKAAGVVSLASSILLGSGFAFQAGTFSSSGSSFSTHVGVATSSSSFSRTTIVRGFAPQQQGFHKYDNNNNYNSFHTIDGRANRISPQRPIRMSDVAVPDESSGSDNGNEEQENLFEGFGVGIMRDLKARAPLFGSDIMDGLNIQCLAATMFLFFACLAPAVGFGGLFATVTKGAIGTVEMVRWISSFFPLFLMEYTLSLNFFGLG